MFWSRSFPIVGLCVRFCIYVLVTTAYFKSSGNVSRGVIVKKLPRLISLIRNCSAKVCVPKFDRKMLLRYDSKSQVTFRTCKGAAYKRISIWYRIAQPFSTLQSNFLTRNWFVGFVVFVWCGDCGLIKMKKSCRDVIHVLIGVRRYHTRPHYSTKRSLHWLQCFTLAFNSHCVPIYINTAQTPKSADKT